MHDQRERNSSLFTILILTSSRVESQALGAFQTATPFTSSGMDEDLGDDQFAIRSSAADDLSLASQVAAMSAFLSRPVSPRPSFETPTSKFQMNVELPDPPTLQHLFNVYFRDFEAYFPFLDRQEIELSIYAVIKRLGYSSHNCELTVTDADLSIIALTCGMLAMAECLDTREGACDGDTRPGWPKYLYSCRALQSFLYAKNVDLNVVRAQCLIASYLLQNGLLSAASRAVATLFQLSITIKLNDQKSWKSPEPREFFARQQLWWTIYYLDRQIARKSSTAYHIRDTEFCVDDFAAPEAQAHDPSLQADFFTPRVRNYMQALINLARLWGQVWDTFFAVGAIRRGGWMEIEIMDTRILNARRQLPQDLTWNSDEISNYTLSGESEPQVRRRLQLYTVSGVL